MSSSNISAGISRLNSTAKPPLNWRTTCAGLEPTVTGVPIGGVASTVSAAPERETSMMRTRCCAPARQGQGGVAVARLDAFVAPILGHAEDLAIGQPSELIGEFLALERRQFHLDREAAVEMTRHRSLDAADLVEIGDDSLADLAARFGLEGDAAGRDVDRRAGEFLPVLAHELAGQAHFDALMAPSFVTSRVDCECCGRSHAGVLPVSAKSPMQKGPH